MQAENSHEDIYELVAQIPKGKVLTYGDIAKALYLPTPRMVGRVLHQNPDNNKTPCHRVVFSNGSLSPAFAFGGEGKQKQLLEAEGVVFQKDHVDLKRSRWHVS
jgi:methylated-DNA-protein-cysteine methyltransferase-like protein